MTSLIYNTGAVSVTKGSAEVTGTGTGWAVALIRYGLFSCDGLSIPIASVESDTSLTLAYSWPGTSGAEKSYALYLNSDHAGNAVWTNRQIADIIKRLSLVGIHPDGAGTLAERNALSPVPQNGFIWLRVEPGYDLEITRKVTSGWEGPFAVRGGKGDKGDTGPAWDGWQGQWITSTAYEKSDTVEWGGSSYICISAHTSGSTTEPGMGANWQTVWNLVAAKGVAGDGTGDVVGPASSTAGRLAVFKDSTGREIEDSGKSVSDFATAAQGAKADAALPKSGGTITGPITRGPVQITATFGDRNTHNQFEFGASNPGGYGSTIGNTSPHGRPFVAFSAEAVTGGINLFRTRGKKGSVFAGDLNGGFTWNTVPVADASDQSLVQTAALDASGNWTISGKATVGAGPTANLDVATKKYVDDGLAAKAPLNSPSFTGTPTAPTPAEGDDTTKLSTTAFVKRAIDKVNDDLAAMNLLRSFAVSLLPDSGRFAGDSAKSTTIGAFVFPSYLTLYNGTTVASAGKFIHNNNDYGGSAGSLPATVKDLVDKIRSPLYRRYGVEFYVAEFTMGSGTSSSALNIGGTNYYGSLLPSSGPMVPGMTFHAYIRALDAPIALRWDVSKTFILDGVRSTAHQVIAPADGWVSMTIHYQVNPYESVGYQPVFFQVDCSASGHRYLLACPALIGGITDVDDNVGVIAGINRWL